MRWCDECQQTVEKCNKSSEPCDGRRDREYMKALAEYEQSSEWLSEPPF